MAALQQKLERFNKQQEKLQATLAKTAVRPSAAPLPKKPPPQGVNGPPAATLQQGSLAPQVPLAQRFSFANDKEKLQQIATIRRAPVGAQIKRVLDLLLETRQTLTPEEINEICFVDVRGHKEVFESLKNNVKVAFDGQRFSYKSKHDLKNKQELLVLIRKVPEGIPIGDLKDSYLGIASDIQELKASGDIWVLMNSDSQEDIVYPNDPKIKIKVDEDVKMAFRRIEMPREFIDVEKDLLKSGMKPASNSAQKQEIARVLGLSQKPKPKKRRESKRTKYTNAHLPELFQMGV